MNKKLKEGEDVEVKGKGMRLHIEQDNGGRFQMMGVKWVLVEWGERGEKTLRVTTK